MGDESSRSSGRIERPPPKREVEGSSPSGTTKPDFSGLYTAATGSAEPMTPEKAKEILDNFEKMFLIYPYQRCILDMITSGRKLSFSQPRRRGYSRLDSRVLFGMKYGVSASDLFRLVCHDDYVSPLEDVCRWEGEGGSCI